MELLFIFNRNNEFTLNKGLNNGHRKGTEFMTNSPFWTFRKQFFHEKWQFDGFSVKEW